MKTITINVTAEDIEEGEPNLCLSCPIALAINRTFPGVTTEAGYAAIYINSYQFRTPVNAQDFILAFDDDEGPQNPFSFDLTVSDDCFLLGMLPVQPETPHAAQAEGPGLL